MAGALPCPGYYAREAATLPGDNTPYAMKSVVVDPSCYDWEGDRPLQRPFDRTVIYEMHVRGFTRDPSSGVARHRRGTYAGLIEKIPYLVDLGITAVELLPVFQFDAQDAPAGPHQLLGLQPDRVLCPPSASTAHGRTRCARSMSSATWSRRCTGPASRSSWMWSTTTPPRAMTGANAQLPRAGQRSLLHPGTRPAALCQLQRHRQHAQRQPVHRAPSDPGQPPLLGGGDARGRLPLRPGVDPLARREGSSPGNPPILWDIDNDPVLAGTKMIAEAWDAAGLYQVGSFVGDHWKEWNGRFRDDVRCFRQERSGHGGDRRLAALWQPRPLWHGGSGTGTEHQLRHLPRRLHPQRPGFLQRESTTRPTANRTATGTTTICSWNCGVEGPTTIRRIEQLRERQIKNFLAITLLSLGAPMLLMGDEVRRTQRGNNNAYCQDNPISWYDWRLHSNIPACSASCNRRSTFAWPSISTASSAA